ncbi:MAG: phenylalanine--tRNA ligase subunit beta [Thaumarchaeota archaeon]|nr:MAG: phenylalanine--tRNA ligase subunit beta [Nitrososphaerota archaeon]
MLKQAGEGMPVLTIKKERFWRLLGRELGDEELSSILQDLGLDVEEIADEHLRVEYNPNRPDFSSPVGIARAMRGLLGMELGAPSYHLMPARTYMEVDPRLRDVRPYVAAAIVRDLRLGVEDLEELISMQEDLHWIVGRDRRKVAIGLHDLNPIKPPFKYVAARGDEYKFIPLGGYSPMTLDEILEKHEKGVKYAHVLSGKPYYPLIVDSLNRVLSFPPIINSRLTELSERTTSMFIDVTGTDFNAVMNTINILTATLIDMGGVVERVRIRYPDRSISTPDYRMRKWRLRKDEVNEVLGLSLSARDIARALRKMRYGVRLRRGSIEAIPPPYRIDIMHEIDLIEDVAIGVGYGNLEPTQPDVLTYGSLHPDTIWEEEIRELMIGLGFTEVMNFTLTNVEDEYLKMRVSPHPHVKLKNPVSAEYSILRTWILPSLMKNLSMNVKRLYPQKLFEVGDVVRPEEGRPEKAARSLRLAAVSSHSSASYSEMKSVVEEALKNLGLGDWSLKPYDSMPFIEGRAAEITWKGNSIGFFGEIHPEVLAEWSVMMPTAAMELDLSLIIGCSKSAE